MSQPRIPEQYLTHAREDPIERFWVNVCTAWIFGLFAVLTWSVMAPNPLTGVPTPGAWMNAAGAYFGWSIVAAIVLFGAASLFMKLWHSRT